MDDTLPKKTSNQCWYVYFKEQELLLIFPALTNRAPFAINTKENRQRCRFFGSLPSSPSESASCSKIFHVKDFRVDSCNILFPEIPIWEGCTRRPSITPESVSSQIHTKGNSATKCFSFLNFQIKSGYCQFFHECQMRVNLKRNKKVQFLNQEHCNLHVGFNNFMQITT